MHVALSNSPFGADGKNSVAVIYLRDDDKLNYILVSGDHLKDAQFVASKSWKPGTLFKCLAVVPDNNGRDNALPNACFYR